MARMNAAARRARRKEQAALRRAKVAKDRQRTRATAIQTNEKSPDESRSFFKSKPSPSTRDLQEALGPPAQLRGQLSQGNKSAQRALLSEMQKRNQGNMPSRLDREGSVREAALAREAELFGGRNPNRRNPQADVPQQRPPVRGASRRTQGREPSRRHLMQTQGPESLGARGQRDLADHARRALESGRAGVPQDARRLTNEQRAGLSAQRDLFGEGEREKQRVESIRKANPGMVAREKEFQARGEALNADIGRQTQGMSPQDRDSFLKTYQPLKDMQADSARFSAEREKLFFGRDAGSAPRRQPSFKTSAGRTPDETRSFFKTQPAPRVDERPDTGYGAPPPASVAQPQTNVTRPQPPTNVTPAPDQTDVRSEALRREREDRERRLEASRAARLERGQSLQADRPDYGYGAPPTAPVAPPPSDRPDYGYGAPPPVDPIGKEVVGGFDPEARLSGPEDQEATEIRDAKTYDFTTPEITTEFGKQQVAAREGALRSAIEQRLLADISGEGGDPETMAMRAEFERNRAKEQRQMVENLQRFGVIGGHGASAGATADVMGEFAGQTNLGRLRMDALAQQAGGRALERAMQYQSGQEDIGLREGQLTGNLRGTSTLDAARLGATTGLAVGDQGLRRQESEAQLGLEGRRVDLEQAKTEEGLRRSRQEREEGRTLFGERVGERERFDVEQDVARRGAGVREDALAEQTAARKEAGALRREEMLGRVGDQTTIAREALTEQAAERAKRQSLEEAQVFGGEGVPGYGGRETVAEKAAKEDRRAGRARERMAETALMGETAEGAETFAAKEARERRELSEAELYGGEGVPGYGGRTTLAGRALTEEQAARKERMDLARAGLLGETEGGVQTDERRQAEAREDLAEAELIGKVGDGTETVASRALTEQQRQAQRREDLAEAELYGGTERTGGEPARETVAQKALAEQAAARRGRERLAEEELFGASTEDPTRETVSSRALAEQERQAKVREGLSEAEVFGGRGEPGYGYRETVAKQALTEDQRQSQVREDLAREELYGGTERTGGDPGRKTVAKQALEEERLARGERMDLAREELVGQVDGEKTVASRALEDEQAARGERMALAREEMYGGRTIQTGPEAVRQETQAAKEASQRHALMEGELLGKFEGKDTVQREALEAELTGRYGRKAKTPSQLGHRSVRRTWTPWLDHWLRGKLRRLQE